MNAPDTIIEDLKRLLGQTIRPGGGILMLSAETPLLSSVPELDSMSLVALVAAIEEHFDIAFDDDDLVEENFLNLANLASVIRQKSEF
jgi:acyl carrier protein